MRLQNLVSGKTLKKHVTSVSSTFKPAIRSYDTGQRIPCFDSYQWLWNGSPISNYKDVSFVHQLTQVDLYIFFGCHLARLRRTSGTTSGPAIWSDNTRQRVSCTDVTRIADVNLTKPVWQRSPCLRDPAVVVVVVVGDKSRPRVIPLAMLTMRKRLGLKISMRGYRLSLQFL